MKRIRKKRLILLSILLAIITGTIITIYFIFISPLPTGDYDEVIEVGQYDNEPKIFEDENGKVVGIFPEILEYIAEKESWKIEYVEGSWTKCLSRLEAGKIDIMVDVAYSEERAEKYDFNNVEVLTNWGIIYTEEGSDIENVEDLDGKAIATMIGSIHTDGAEGIKNMTIKWGISATFIEVEDYDEVFELVDDGKADVGVVNRLFGLLNEDEYDVEKTTIIFNPRRLMFAFPKGEKLSKKLIPIIDEHLLDLKDDPNSVYYQIIDKYLYGREFILPFWVIPTIIAAVALVIILAAVSYGLKRIVDKRTAELQKAHDDLEDKVEERTKELIVANIRLKELDRLKSMFLASMSHELRTPLNSIIGFTGWLLMGMEGDLNEEQDKQLGMVKSSANHLLDLINDILDISKIEAGKIYLNIEEFDITEVVNDVGDSLIPLAMKKNLKLEYNAPEGLKIHTDKRRIRQILMNLTGNAIKFTESGNVSIDVKQINKDQIEITVSDTGIGITPEDLDMLFKPFQQVDMSSTKKQEGSGLGLYLSKKLLDLLQGSISVKSRYGEGSEFIFILPIKINEGI